MELKTQTLNPRPLREEPRAGLHDDVLADLLPRGQTVRQSRATHPRCTDVSDWVTTSVVQPIFGDSDSFNCKSHGCQLAPSRCIPGGGSVLDVVVQPNPGLSKVPFFF